MSKTKPSKRDQLVSTACRLFAAQGYRGTGIDQIAEEARVTKKTMYHHFRSKDELILAVLEDHRERYLHDFRLRVEARSEDPRERLLAVFDVAEEWFAGDDFYGCMFINAVAEYAGPDSNARAVSQEFKRLERSYFEYLADKAEVPDPSAFADSIALLLEGAIVTAQVSGRPDSARAARRTAEQLLKCVLSKKATEF